MASTKEVGPYKWHVPLQGVKPWDGLADVLYNEMGLSLQENKVYTGGFAGPATIKWGDVTTGNYLQADFGADSKVFGAWDRQNLPWRNQTVVL